jgi:hypothetical protein
MTPEARMWLLLEERKRRAIEVAAADGSATSVVTQLRAWYHPAQAIFFSRENVLLPRDRVRRWRATKKTRRSGATSGGVREFIARAIEQPDWRGSYVTNTAKDARGRAWENDTKSGFAQIIRQIGTPIRHRSLEAYIIDGVNVEVRNGDMVLDFSNGSQIEVFGADNAGDHKKRRGFQKHVIWIDEAQEFPLLEEFFDAVVIGCLTETVGDCWLTGTPSVDCAGMFFEITKEEEAERLPNWFVHILTSTMNPFFGAVIKADDGYLVQDNAGGRFGPYDTKEEAEKIAVEVRWDRTAGDAKRAKNWKGDEPDFVREWLGKWVKTDSRYVYPVHGVPDHVLIYAPQRLRDNPIDNSHPPWFDVDLSMRDLPLPPQRANPYQWLIGVGVDFGYWPDPFAMVILAFCYAIPDVYELFSWKHTKVNTDDQGRYMKEVWKIPRIVSFVGDAAGKQSDFNVWQTRMNIPIEEANKKGKNELEEFLANDIRCERVHFRSESPLLTEMRHLVYLPTKPGKTREVNKHRKVAGVVHGDHCSDGARYLYNDLRHYLAKPPIVGPEPGSREWHNAQADRERSALERMQRRSMDD